MRDHGLVDLIRLLEGWPGKVQKGSVLVVLRGDGRAIESSPRMARLLSRLPRIERFIYEVRLDRPVEIWEAQSAIRPFLSNEDTSLKFRIQVMANATNAERIAEALHHEADSSADVLLARVRQIVTKLIDQEIGGGAEQIGNRILRHRLDWQKRISHSLHDVTGLASTIIFEGTPRSETLELSLDAHPVSPRDAPHASLPLTAYATLEPTGDVPLDPLPPTREAILDSILFAAREFLTDRSPEDLRELNYGILASRHSSSIKQELEDHIDRHITAHYGFHIRLENVTTFRPLSEKVQLRGRSYRDHEIDATLDISFDALERDVIRAVRPPTT